MFMLAETLGCTVTGLMHSGMSSLEFTMWMVYLNTKAQIQDAIAKHAKQGWDVETAIGYVKALEG